MLDCAPSLDSFVTEVDAGLAFVRRTGDEETAQWLNSYRWLAGALRGEESAVAGEALSADTYSGTSYALFLTEVSHSIAAAIFGDTVGLARHSAAGMALLPAGSGVYPTAGARLLRGRHLWQQNHDGHGCQCGNPQQT